MSSEEPLAIQFSDLREFTALTAQRGDQEAFRLVRGFVELVESHVADHGGRVLKTYGDGVMTSFDDLVQAVDCSIEMQSALCAAYCHGEETTLSAGVGLTWGSAIRTEDDLFGSSVNLAKRIADIAKGGQIVVSSAVARHATLEATEHRFRTLGDRALKGLGEQRLFELVWRNEVAMLETIRDDMEFILTADNKLVIQFAKQALDEIRDVQEHMAGLGDGEDGLEGRIKRAIGKRLARKIPDVIEWATARSGLGMEHALDDIEVKLVDGTFTLSVKGRRPLSLDRKNVNLEAAERFFESVKERKRLVHKADSQPV